MRPSSPRPSPPRRRERVTTISCACALLALGFCGGRWSAPPRGDARLEETPAPPPPLFLADVTAEVAPQLYAPPARLGDVAVPSVVHDARGAVHNLRVGGFRFNVLVSRPGSLRSGDVHRRRQFDVVFAGRVRVTTRERGRDVARTYGAGALIEIPPNVPHLFAALDETSVMAEWWGGDGAFETRYYRPYRRRVDEALAALLVEASEGGKGGKNVRAVAADPDDPAATIRAQG